MDAFNILKFWRTAAVRDIVSDLDSVNNFVDYIHRPLEADEIPSDDEDSFFDLVFTRHPKENNNTKSVSETNLPKSPKDVFLKPKAFSLDSNSKPLSLNSILRSAPKFRVCFLGFRKSKPENVGVDDSSTGSPNQEQKPSPKAQSNRFTMKCKVEEVPASCISFRYNKSLKGSQVQNEEEISSVKDSSKQNMPKYLKLMKPLYSRASKRYTDNIKISDNVSRASQLSSPLMQSLSLPRKSSEDGKQGSRVAVLGVVRKQLRKSRSTASSVASPMNRRDDSLLEQNDGIQGAILHCKRCYSSAAKDCSISLSRSTNEDISRVSSEELNRWSI